jgi:hypothetical protein
MMVPDAMRFTGWNAAPQPSEIGRFTAASRPRPHLVMKWHPGYMSRSETIHRFSLIISGSSVNKGRDVDPNQTVLVPPGGVISTNHRRLLAGAP